MAVTASANSLPQPVIFAHAETLHAIPLPPLASFLVSLHKAEHLVKLNDILDRYRTPKTYHRIDVRLVESSELPPGTPESFTSRERRGSREPVVLEEGVDVYTYLAERRPAPEDIPNTAGEVNVDGQEQADDGLGGAGAGPKEDAEDEEMEEIIDLRQVTAASEENSRKEAHVVTASDQAATDDEDIHESITVTGPFPSGRPEYARCKPNPDPEPVTPSTPRAAQQNQPPSPPVPTHPLPPIGPTRRVRELRLDLRTLDAAALFALESWRREVTGLDKMEMEFPDSIWYKDPTPTPTPPSLSPPRETGLMADGKKRGRPKKDRPSEVGQGSEPIIVVDDDEREQILCAGVCQEKPEEPVQGGMTEAQMKGYETLVSALKGDTDPQDSPADNDGEEQEEIEEKPILLKEALEPLNEKPASVNHQSEETAEVDGDQPVQPELYLNPNPSANADAVASANAEAGPSTTTAAATSPLQQPKSPSPLPPSSPPADTPSPDILLHDAFNENEDDDPDFVPPPEAAPRRRGGGGRPGRPRKNPLPPTIITDKDKEHSGILVTASVIPEAVVVAADEAKRRPGRPSDGRRVSFDLTPTEMIGPDPGPLEGQVKGKTVTFAESLAGPSKTRRSRSRKDDDIIIPSAEAGPSTSPFDPFFAAHAMDQGSLPNPNMVEEDLTRPLRGIGSRSRTSSLTPNVDPIAYTASILKNNIRSLSSESNSDPIPSYHVPDPNPGPSPRTPAKKPRNSNSNGRGKRKMVVEIPSASKRIKMMPGDDIENEDGDEDEDEEWGFLKAFGST
ncbi:hypothetical protein IAT40_006472 [Kwoniella sp. CBS 6097]